MITRTTKYVARDSTEHDSPQAAAQQALQNYLCKLIEQCWPGISDRDLDELTTGLARNPEALRDALNTYFEDLEAHPDVEDFGCDPAYFDDGEIAPGVRGFAMLTPTGAVVPGAGYVPAGTPVYGDPNDPSTWRTEENDQ